jgi:hypothetical protein
MSLEISFRTVCDACGVGGPISLRGALDACQKSKKKKWIEVQIHSGGLSLCFCDECAEIIRTCKICDKKTFDPRIDNCGSCGWKDAPLP